MTTDADERPKDETALEAEVSEAPAQTPDEAPSQTAAEAPAPVEEAPAAEASVEAPVEPATETPAPTAEAPAADAPAEPATEAPVPAAEAPVADAPAEPTTESPAPTAEAPTADAPAEPATEAPAEAAEAPTADAPAEPTAQAPAPAAEAPTADAPVEPTAQAPAPVETPAPTDGTPAEAGAQTPGPKDEAKPAAKKPRRRKPRERRKPVPETPRARVPLPLDELRDASRSTMNLFGPRRALRDALGVLAPREKQELNVLIAADEDHRPRARNIANGSIGAGRIDKAMAATIVSMAPQEELWGVLLDKEQAAQKLGRIREAKQRDKQRADRAKERANRTDRVSREDMAKATDGRVGATIRFVTADEKRDRRDKDTPEKKPSGGGSVLDRLGY